MKEYKYRIKKAEKPTDDVVILELEDKSGKPVFNFKSGQYVLVSYKNDSGKMTDKHAFSIASPPSEKRHIRLGIKILGNFTQGISKLEEGAEIFVSGPFGDFIFDAEKHKDAVFLAGGIGITPFISALREATEKRLPNRLSLIYSNRTVKSTIFFREIKELEEQNKNISTLFSITEEKITPNIEGVVNERINKQIISKCVGEVSGKTFFLCGPLKFMESAKSHLTSLGVMEKQIITEEFSMIPDAGFWPILKNLSYAAGFSIALAFLPFYIIYTSGKGGFNSKDLTLEAYKSANLYGAVKIAYDQIISGSKPKDQDAENQDASGGGNFRNKKGQ